MTLQNKLLDDTSWKLLEELQKDGRASYRELGNQIGLSTPAVSERIRKLEKEALRRLRHRTCRLFMPGIRVRQAHSKRCLRREPKRYVRGLSRPPLRLGPRLQAPGDGRRDYPAGGRVRTSAHVGTEQDLCLGKFPPGQRSSAMNRWPGFAKESMLNSLTAGDIMNTQVRTNN